MKLPGIDVGGVQSLARQDVGMPIRAQEAKTQAMLTMGDAVVKWQTARDEASARYALAQASKDETALRTKLINERTYTDNDGTMVPMHEVMSGLYDDGTKQIRKDYTNDLSFGAKAMFNKNYDDKLMAGAQQIVKGEFDQKYEYISAQMLASWDQAIKNGDEIDAMASIEAGLTTGSMSFVEYEKYRIETGERIDKQAYLDRMMTASSDGQLDRIERDLANNIINGHESRLTIEDRISLMGSIGGFRSRLNRGETANQTSLMNELYVQNQEGNLNQESLTELVRTGQLKYSNAVIASKWIGAELGLDEKSFDQVSRSVTTIAMPRPGETVTQGVQRAQNEISAMTTGMYADGTPYLGARISAEQSASLSEQLVKVSNSVFNSEPYRTAKTHIGKATGVDGLVDLSKNSNNSQAYMAFTRDLRSFMDREGATADPVKWVQDNQGKYDPTLFDRSGVKDSTALKARNVPLQVIDSGPDMIRAYAIQANRDNKMSVEDSNFILRHVEGQNVPVNFETALSDEEYANEFLAEQQGTYSTIDGMSYVPQYNYDIDVDVTAVQGNAELPSGPQPSRRKMSTSEIIEGMR